MHNHALALELAYTAVEECLRLGAAYAEARHEQHEVEEVRTRNRELVTAHRTGDRGIGIRVLVRGTWAFVAISEPNRHDVVVGARRVVESARAAAILRDRPASLSETEPQRGAYKTVFQTDPAHVPLDRKLELLRSIDDRLLARDGIVLARSHLRFRRRRKILVTSEGSEVEQDLLTTGVGFEAGASRGEGLQTVTFPGGRGSVAGRGWEWVEGLGLVDATDPVADRALEQLSAEACPAGDRTLILDAEAVSSHLLQTVRVLEADRIFGLETAGQSVPVPSSGAGSRLGSPHLDLSLDPQLEGGAGSAGFDDEGMPAQAVSLVQAGTVQSLMTGREAAQRLQQSNSTGSMRAASWSVRPHVRASNLVMGSGEAADMDALVADTADGVVVQGLRALSLDPASGEFVAVGELAWEVKDGQRVRPLRNPAFRGSVLDFWGRLDAATQHAETSGQHGGPKGRPLQFLSTGVRAPAARFQGVEIGTSDLPRSDSVDLPIVVGTGELPPES